MIKFLNILLIFIALVLQGCFLYGKKESLSLDTVIKKKQTLDATLSSVDVSNNHVTITGVGFSNVTSVRLQGSGGVDTNLTIDSKSNSQIIASATSALSLLVGGTFDLIIGTAEAQATYTITFTLQNGAVVAANLASMGAISGQVLKYNGSAWAPASLASSQTYLGTWNANTNTPDISTLGSYQNGDYYIVSTAGTYNAIAYLAGDWAMFNGTAWERIDNTSNSVASFNGRTGIVTLVPADYVSLKDATSHKVTGSSLNDIADIDLVSLPPTNGQILKWNTATSKWEPSDDLTSGGAGSVGATEVAAGSIANTHVSATAAIAQSKIANLTTDLAAKEATLTAGTTAQYYRGDKSWQTLDTSVVPENTRLYFTEPRVLATAITAPTLTNSAIATGDSIQVAFGKAQAQIGAHTTSIGTKADSTNIAQTITAVAVTGLTAPVAGSDATNKTYVDGAITANGVWAKSGTTINYGTGNVGIGTTTPETNLEVNGALRVSGTGTDLFVTPVGSSVPTKINIPLLNPGNFGQILIMGLPSTASNSARAASFVDARTTVNHQPTVAVLTPDESQIFGLSADGSNSSGYLTSTVDLGFKTNGTERMHVLSTGDIGIGTTSPGTRLDVVTSGTNDDSIRVNTPNSDGGIRLKNTSAAGAEWYLDSAGTGTTYSEGNLHFVKTINSTPTMTLTSSNVGIGTTTPTALLNIGAPTAASSGAVTMTAASAATTFTTSATVTLNAGDYVIPTTTTGQARSVTTTATGTSFSVTPAFSAAVAAQTYNVYKPALNVFSSNLLVQGSTGNVGIGTSNPVHKIELASSTASSGGIGFGTDVELYKSSTGQLKMLAAGQTYNNYLNIDLGQVWQYGVTLSAGGNGGSTIRYASSVMNANDVSLLFGNQSASAIRYDTSAGTGLHVLRMETYTGGVGNASGYVFINNVTQDRLPSASVTDPHLRIYSSDGTQASDYIEFFHDQTDAVINGGNGNLSLNSSGYVVVPTSSVGIGTATPSYKLDVQGGDINASGSVRAATVALTSDRRWKRNISPLKNSIEKIKKINGVSYDWASEDYPEKHFSSRKQIGVIAQDVQTVFPELILKDNEGFLSVNYPGLIAPLIEAFKAQEELIEANVRMFKIMQGDIEAVKLLAEENKRDIASLKKEKDKEIFELKVQVGIVLKENSSLKKENDLIKARLNKIEKMLLK